MPDLHQVSSILCVLCLLSSCVEETNVDLQSANRSLLSGNPKQATRLYKAIEKKNRTRSQLGQLEVLEGENELEEAHLLCKTFNESDETTALLISCARLAQKIGKGQEALKYLERSQKEKNNSASLLQALILAEQGETEKALSALEQTDSIILESPHIQELKLTLLLAKEDYLQAQKLLETMIEKAITSHKSTQYKRTLIDLLAQQGKNKAASKILTELIEAEPQDSSLLFRRAVLRGAQGQYEEAKRDLAAVLALTPDYTPALLLRASLEFEQKAFNSALKTIDSVLAREETNAQALLLKTRVLLAQNNKTKASETLEMVLKIAPEDPEANLAKALILAEVKKNREALPFAKLAQAGFEKTKDRQRLKLTHSLIQELTST